ncbi:MAG: phasin family protein [Thermoanaerobaculia bacterium]|nr:phasin family protein [Thermoanaerobaculia bacterium]MCZ7651049.1 phasin family protein [Thermoanaerobaculia bacterium]
MNIQEMAKEARHDVEQLGGEAASQARNLWLAGLGFAGAVVEETVGLFDSLVAKGRDSDFGDLHLEPKALLGEATKRVDRTMHEVGERAKDTFESATHGLFERFGVPTRGEVHRLIERVERLNAKLARMQPHA